MKNLRLPIAAITDEFSPSDLERAAAKMQSICMTGAELRVVWDKNIMDLTDAELDRAKSICDAHGLKIISVA
jgi:sugar phosphate isomerase/epimerase